jgi:integrase
LQLPTKNRIISGMPKRKNMKVHRKEWPRIREVLNRGTIYFSVDARKMGTNGKQIIFGDLAKATEHAVTLAGEHVRSGTESTAISTRLRIMAIDCEAQLRPFDRTIQDATTHYVEHLKALHAKRNSKALAECLAEWLAAKADKTEKVRSPRTLEEIKGVCHRLEQAFPVARVAQIETTDVRSLLRADYEPRTRKNLLSKVNQFFRWTIRHGYRTANPCDTISVHVPKNDDVSKLGATEALALMRTCEKQFPELVPYIAVCLFAGLRPNSEALGLTWENISLENPAQIRVLASTSKVRDNRLFEIEPNLIAWLTHYGKNKKGVLAPANWRYQTEKLRIALGYKVRGENEEGPEWIADTLRHTYATLWLAKFKHRHQLAEYMGTSAVMIRNHYKSIVKPSEVEKFWNIIPKPLDDARKLKQRQDEESNRKILQFG